MKNYLIFSLLLLPLILCGSASAEPVSSQIDDRLYGPSAVETAPPEAAADSNPSRLKASVGVGAVMAPEFEGSNEYEVVALPMVDIRYDRFFLSWAQGLGFDAYSDESWTFSPSLRYRFGRDEDDSPLLRGLGDTDDGAEIGGRISWHPYSVGLSLSAFHGLGDAEGYTVDLAAFHRRQLLDSLGLTLAASVLYADAAYNEQHFGISAAQSAASGYRAYEPGGGLKHWALSGGLSWAVSPRISLEAFGQFKQLTGPAADSPLVEAGSAEQFMGGLSLNFSLGN